MHQVQSAGLKMRLDHIAVAVTGQLDGPSVESDSKNMQNSSISRESGDSPMNTLTVLLTSALAVTMVAAPGFAQVAPPVSVVQPLQTGSVTSGTSAATNPRLDQTKAPDATKDASSEKKPVESSKPEPSK